MRPLTKEAGVLAGFLAAGVVVGVVLVVVVVVFLPAARLLVDTTEGWENSFRR